jgi:superfamily II DNA/RNA helicase
VLVEDPEKMLWLEKHISACLQRGKVLIFVNHVNTCNILSNFFTNKLGIVSACLHGDKNQF